MIIKWKQKKEKKNNKYLLINNAKEKFVYS